MPTKTSRTKQTLVLASSPESGELASASAARGSSRARALPVELAEEAVDRAVRRRRARQALDMPDHRRISDELLDSC